MEEVYVKREVSEKRYKAIDGTLFTTESECRKFEESAECVIRHRLMSIVKETIEGQELYNKGVIDSEGYTGYVIVLDSKDKIDILNVFFNFCHANLFNYDNINDRTILLMIDNYDNKSFYTIDLKEKIEAMQSIIDRNNKPF